MKNDTVTRELAEALREIYKKINALESLTGFYVYEYFNELDRIRCVLLDLLNVPPWDMDEEIVDDYLHGKIDYEDMLSKVREAVNSFDPDAYESYVKDYIKAYGVSPNGRDTDE